MYSKASILPACVREETNNLTNSSRAAVNKRQVGLYAWCNNPLSKCLLTTLLFSVSLLAVIFLLYWNILLKDVLRKSFPSMSFNDLTSHIFSLAWNKTTGDSTRLVGKKDGVTLLCFDSVIVCSLCTDLHLWVSADRLQLEPGVFPVIFLQVLFLHRDLAYAHINTGRQMSSKHNSLFAS